MDNKIIENFGRSSFGETDSRLEPNIFKKRREMTWESVDICSWRRYSLNTELQSFQGIEVGKDGGTMISNGNQYKRHFSSSSYGIKGY